MEKFIDWLEANGYSYKDEDIYLEACTHSSYANEHHREMGDNERLEFMGDSVLQIWSATQLFLMQPKMREGQMTTLRAQTVCESTLAVLNRQLGWYEFLRLGVGEEKQVDATEKVFWLINSKLVSELFILIRDILYVMIS